ncbi:hypothetical protein [Clostridioides sp. ZZV14-6045]
MKECNSYSKIDNEEIFMRIKDDYIKVCNIYVLLNQNTDNGAS